MGVIERLTLCEIEESRPVQSYYGADTRWWTHDPAHLSLTPEPTEERVRGPGKSMRANAGRADAPLDKVDRHWEMYRMASRNLNSMASPMLHYNGTHKS